MKLVTAVIKRTSGGLREALAAAGVGHDRNGSHRPRSTEGSYEVYRGDEYAAPSCRNRWRSWSTITTEDASRSSRKRHTPARSGRESGRPGDSIVRVRTGEPRVSVVASRMVDQSGQIGDRSVRLA